MQRKLDWLSPISDPPDSKGNVYVNMKFDDGTIAYKGAKPDAMVNHYADLLGIQKSGELVEIELEDTGKKTQKGATKYKLVGYPGWSAPVAQGGKAQANANGGGGRDTGEEIHRSVALKLAVKQNVSAESKEAYEKQVSELFYFYLTLLRGEGQQDAEVRASGDEAAKPITERTTDPIPASTSVHDGEGVADESKGATGSAGGQSGPVAPKGENPWAGLDVVDVKP